MPGQFDGIAADAQTATALITKATLRQRIEDLESKLAEIEPLLEQLQASSKIGPNLATYVSDLREEQVFFNRARYAVGALSGCTVLGLIVILALAIFSAKSPLLDAPPIAIATFIVGMVSGIIFLLAAFVKGVFRSTAERHADGFLPPALETSIDLLQKIAGKS